MPSPVYPLRRVLTANTTSSSFTIPIPKATEPSGSGVIDLLSTELGWGLGSMVPSLLQIIPFGVGTDTQTFDMRVYGWSKVASETLYMPSLLIDISAALGPGVGTAIGTDVLVVDTITVNDGPADSSEWRSLIDCQEDMPASVAVHTRGFRYLSFDFDMTGATNGNAFVRPFEV